MDTADFLQHLNFHIGQLIQDINPENKCKCEACNGKKWLLSSLLDMQRAILSENKTAHLFAIDSLIDAHDNLMMVSLAQVNEAKRKEAEPLFFETRSKYLQARDTWITEFGDECLQ